MWHFYSLKHLHFGIFIFLFLCWLSWSSISGHFYSAFSLVPPQNKISAMYFNVCKTCRYFIKLTLLNTLGGKLAYVFLIYWPIIEEQWAHGKQFYEVYLWITKEQETILTVVLTIQYWFVGAKSMSKDDVAKQGQHKTHSNPLQ